MISVDLSVAPEQREASTRQDPSQRGKEGNSQISIDSRYLELKFIHASDRGYFAARNLITSPSQPATQVYSLLRIYDTPHLQAFKRVYQ